MRGERRQAIPEPGQTVLLSAGPGVGKTRTLRAWEQALSVPAVYLRLTPEDHDPAFLQERLTCRLSPFLSDEGRADLTHPGAGCCDLLSTLPVMALLLDDWHAIEGSEAARGLAGALWSLPAGSIVALASRHRFEGALALAACHWSLEEDGRSEQPSREDLADLPFPLRDFALALALVGEAPSSPEALELVRRNVAFESAPGLFALRPAWRVLAADLRPAFAAEATWDAAENLIAAFAERHRWTVRHGEIAALLQAVPPEARASRLGLIVLEGAWLYGEAAYREALDCFERASRMQPEDLELVWWRVEVLALLDPQAGWALLRELQPLTPEAMHIWLLGAEARLHYIRGDFLAAERAFLAVLEQPLAGDRGRVRQHLLALCSLVELAVARHGVAVGWDALQRLEDLHAHWGFEADLPWSALARQKIALLDLSRRPLLDPLVGVPNVVCAGSFSNWVVLYLYNLACTTYQLGLPELALRVFQLCERETLSRMYNDVVRLAVRWGQIEALADLERMDEARRFQGAYLRHFSSDDYREVACLAWARLQLRRGEYAEADEALAACDPVNPMMRHRHHLFSELLRLIRGEEAARDRIHAWFETPDGDAVRRFELDLLQVLGLTTEPMLFRVSAFGPLELSRKGSTPIHWSRRKASHLFAHLVLHPEGLPFGELAERLFDDDGPTPPLQALHFVAHALRQALKESGAEHLLDSSQGIMRLDWGAIAFCDLHAFDAFYRRARSLEADGFQEAAALFFEIALCYARGELFENLPEDFAEQRAAYRQQVRYAQNYAHRHAH